MSIHIKKGRALGSLSLTPLIDVVFLLLIFFLVATKFEEEERSIDVVLPQASEAMPATAKPKELFINIDDKGRFYVASDQVTAEQLFAVLRQASANNPGRQTVIIRGDGRSSLQAAVTVMDLCNKAHIREYRLTTAEPGT